MLSIRIGQKRNNTNIAQGITLGPYGIAPDAQGMRPSALQVQVKRGAGVSAHSVTIEGSNSITGPFEILATITDELNKKISATLPDYVRFNVGTATGGNVDILVTGAVN